jgi:hypothetical protein
MGRFAPLRLWQCRPGVEQVPWLLDLRPQPLATGCVATRRNSLGIGQDGRLGQLAEALDSTSPGDTALLVSLGRVRTLAQGADGAHLEGPKARCPMKKSREVLL